jgi:two-component system, NtrC family, sensor histidine kinase HydH
MKKGSTAENAFKKQLILASLFFAVFFISLLSIGAYIIIKDLGEKEVFRLLDHYTRELENMMATIPETEKAKGFQYETIVTTRINQFMVDKKIFDSYEIYGSDGKLIQKNDVLKGGQLYAAPDIQNPPVGKAHIEIRNKMPIEVSVPVAPGQMGKAVLNVSSQVLALQAKDFRNEMILKFSVLLSLLFLMLLLSYLYVLRLLRVSNRIQQESEEQKRLSYLGLLSSGLAHEIKNPLNSLKLNVQLLEEGLKTNVNKEELSSSVEPMLNQIKRLERLTRDFLLYARPSEPELKVQNLRQLLEELILSFGEEIKSRSLTVDLEAPESVREIPIDENMIRTALSNLILNAIQASEESGRIAIEVKDAESEVQIDVIDEGSGIAQESKEKIFEIFYTNKSGGTGLGLSIAKRFVELHQGKIELIDRERGAHFRVTLKAFPDIGN